MKTEYYNNMLECGMSYEKTVYEFLESKFGIKIKPYSTFSEQITIGENNLGIEIKNDRKFRQTGNLYIEVAERSSTQITNWTPSGIMRNDNTKLYLIGDSLGFYKFRKTKLVEMINSEKFRKVYTSTSVGYLIPVDVIENSYEPME